MRENWVWALKQKNAHKMFKKKNFESKMTSNDQELIQSDPTSCPQNQKGNN